MADEKFPSKMLGESFTTSQFEPVVSTATWNRYVSNLHELDPFASDTTRIHQEINQYGSRLFRNQTNLEVLEINGGINATVKGIVCKSDFEVEQLLERPTPDFRLFSFLRQQSISNYTLVPNSLIRIMSRHAIQPSFADLLIGFRNPRPHAESGYGIWHSSKSVDQDLVISYQFRYMELNNRNNGIKWSLRQLGVHHQVKPRDCGGNVLLLAHGNQECRVKQWIEQQCAPNTSNLLNLVPGRPFALHTMVFSTYLCNWRWYLEDLGQTVEDVENEWITIDLDSIADEMSFTHLQQLRDVDSELLTAMTILETTTETIACIQQKIETMRHLCPVKPQAHEIRNEDTDVELKKDETALFDLLQRCRCYLRSVTEIQRRNQKLIHLASDGINLSAQRVASRVSNSVRIVTIITLIYLPAQFVATFFGTNFVLFEPETSLMRFAKNFWIFLAVSIPLTVITILLWLATTRGYLTRLASCWRTCQALGCSRRITSEQV